MDQRTHTSQLEAAFEAWDEEEGEGGAHQLHALQELQALAEQEEDKLPKSLVTQLRLKGYTAVLLSLCRSRNGPVRRAALVITRAGARVDVAFNAQLLKDGVVAKLLPLMAKHSGPYASIKKSARRPASSEIREEDLYNMGLAFRILGRVALPEIPSASPTQTLEALFRHGYVARASALLGSKASEFVLESALGLIGTVSLWKACRDRVADMGVIPHLVTLAKQGRPGACSTLSNLSRSDSLLTTLRDEGLFEAMQSFAQKVQDTDGPEMTKALIAVANVYGSIEAQDSPAGKLLSSYDVSLSVVSMLDAVLHGDRSWNDLMFTLDEAVHAARALSCSAWLAFRMHQMGTVEMLVELLHERDEDSDATLHACQALLNLSRLPHLHSSLIKSGVPDAVTRHIDHTDIRVGDAARGALLQLHLLNDKAAQDAYDAQDSDTTNQEQMYNVFLSHKRSDAKDFARALYNLLVLRGVSTFLDYEYNEELQLEGGLAQLVSNCRNFVFVLTDNVLDSKWVLQELEAAVDSQVNIILVVKEGSRWMDLEGKKSLPFPSPQTLAGLPPKLKPVFTKKAIYHSDEYYSSFIDALLKKINANLPPVVPPHTPKAPSQAATTAHGDDSAFLPAIPTAAARHSCPPALATAHTLPPALVPAPPAQHASQSGPLTSMNSPPPLSSSNGLNPSVAPAAAAAPPRVQLPPLQATQADHAAFAPLASTSPAALAAHAPAAHSLHSTLLGSSAASQPLAPQTQPLLEVLLLYSQSHSATLEMRQSIMAMQAELHMLLLQGLHAQPATASFVPQLPQPLQPRSRPAAAPATAGGTWPGMTGVGCRSCMPAPSKLPPLQPSTSDQTAVRAAAAGQQAVPSPQLCDRGGAGAAEQGRGHVTITTGIRGSGKQG